MTEAEILAELAIRTDRMWGLIQWWASITFGVILAAHLGAKLLNRPFVILILIVFSLFTVTVFQAYSFHGQAAGAAISDLRAISEQAPLSQLTDYMIADSPLFRFITLALTLMFTYIGTVYYVVYAYRTKGSNNSEKIEHRDDDT